ncbi:hypothetical protein MRB53_037141 [Persea americana]|nr:hypothetical protein MRB53_037141 [Persea americana]
MILSFLHLLSAPPLFLLRPSLSHLRPHRRPPWPRGWYHAPFDLLHNFRVLHITRNDELAISRRRAEAKEQRRLERASKSAAEHRKERLRKKETERMIAMARAGVGDWERRASVRGAYGGGPASRSSRWDYGDSDAKRQSLSSMRAWGSTIMEEEDSF